MDPNSNEVRPRVPPTLSSLQRRPRRAFCRHRNHPTGHRPTNRRSIQRHHHQPRNRHRRSPSSSPNRRLFFPKAPSPHLHPRRCLLRLHPIQPRLPPTPQHRRRPSKRRRFLLHYRLAPEHPLPIAYDDTWEAIQWAAGASDHWLKDHANLGLVFFAGDSAGANLAHNMAMRGSSEGFGALKLQGVVLIHPYFGNEENNELVKFLYPTYGGLDDPKIHAVKDPKLSGMGCKKVLVLVAEKDFLRERGRSYYEALKESGWSGVVDMVETEGEGHVFHLIDPTMEKSVALVKQFVSFMTQIEKDVRRR